MTAATVAIVLGGCEMVLLFAVRVRLRETTLTAAWWWAVTATMALTLLEAGAALWGLVEESAETLRFAAAALTFCPMMSVLGAKRPQHQAWQFVVFSLWGVLSLPAVENLILRGGQAMVIHDVRLAFLAGLIGLGVMNWLPTRFWLASLLVAAGQVLLFADYLPLGALTAYGRSAWIGAACFLAATTVVWATQVIGERRPVAGLDRVWRDFRDSFGALWAMRVAERINAAATMYDWDLHLGWSGFRRRAGTKLRATDLLTLPPELETTLDNLLRRFASAEWIAKRRQNALH